MDRGAWWATVHGVRRVGHDLGTKKLYTHTHTHTHLYICHISQHMAPKKDNSQ